MNFHYEYTTKASDLWQMSMYYVYSSFMAIVNIIAIASSIALIVTFYGTAGPVGRGLMILYLMMFTVIQPVSIYARSKKQLAGHEKNLSLTFQDSGMTVECDGETQTLEWSKIRYAVKPTLVVIYTGGVSGYILSNRVLKNTRRDLIKALREKIK